MTRTRSLTALYWRRAVRYVRRQLVWNNVYRASSYLRSALWVVPLFAILLVLVLAPVLRWLDSWIGWRLAGLSLRGAQSLFDSVISLTLSFIVFTFGSLLVAIQVASGQLTPRIIATTLLRDNVVRYSVGLFVFTLVFAITALNRLETAMEAVTLLTALLGVACTATFLFLIDYAARLLRPASIVARVASKGLQVIKTLYPSPVDATQAERKDAPRPADLPHRVVRHDGRSEHVLAIDLDTLIREAVRVDGIIEVLPRVGDFVAADAPIFKLYGGATAIRDHRLEITVAYGTERTIEQDPLYAFRIMIDIALKALSPAINDPTTAVHSIDQIHRLLRVAGGRDLKTDALRDRSGAVRVILRTPSWEDFVTLAFTEIRLAGAGQVQIARRLRSMIDQLVATLPAHRHQALEREAVRLTKTIEVAYRLPDDLALARIADVQGLGAPDNPPSVAG